MMSFVRTLFTKCVSQISSLYNMVLKLISKLNSDKKDGGNTGRIHHVNA